MKQISKNRFENLRIEIGLNVYERQKYSTKNNNKKKTYNKAQQQLDLLYHESCINLKR